MGMILGLVGVVLLAGSIYLAITYLGDILNAMVEFVTNNSSAISRCGVTVPEKIVQLRDDVATTILPGIYLGVPLAVIIISVIMFAGGYLYGKGSYQDQLNRDRKQERAIEEEVERRIVRKKQKPKPVEENQ
jgi:hypothetical protein